MRDRDREERKKRRRWDDESDESDDDRETAATRVSEKFNFRKEKREAIAIQKKRKSKLT